MLNTWVDYECGSFGLKWLLRSRTISVTVKRSTLRLLMCKTLSSDRVFQSFDMDLIGSYPKSRVGKIVTIVVFYSLPKFLFEGLIILCGRRIVLPANKSLGDSAFFSRHWDNKLSSSSCTLCPAKYVSMGTSPYNVVFGRSMVTHGSTYVILWWLNALNDANLTVCPQDKLPILKPEVQMRILLTRKAQQKVYNLRCRGCEFQVRDGLSGSST